MQPAYEPVNGQRSELTRPIGSAGFRRESEVGDRVAKRRLGLGVRYARA
jgi:hypothetical protein